MLIRRQGNVRKNGAYEMSAAILPFCAMEDLPNRIRALRTAKGLSLDTLSATIGCSKVQLGDLELGKRRLSTMWMGRIAPALGVSPADLLKDDQNPFRLNDAEMKLVEAFRAASDDQQQTIQRVVDAIVPANDRDQLIA